MFKNVLLNKNDTKMDFILINILKPLMFCQRLNAKIKTLKKTFIIFEKEVDLESFL